MNLAESLRVALRALGANKLRSALTMLGIVIGVAAVIALMAAGQGVQVFVTEQFQGIGSNLLFVLPSVGPNTRFGGTTSLRSLTMGGCSGSFGPPPAAGCGAGGAAGRPEWDSECRRTASLYHHSGHHTGICRRAQMVSRDRGVHHGSGHRGAEPGCRPGQDGRGDPVPR